MFEKEQVQVQTTPQFAKKESDWLTQAVRAAKQNVWLAHQQPSCIVLLLDDDRLPEPTPEIKRLVLECLNWLRYNLDRGVQLKVFEAQPPYVKQRVRNHNLPADWEPRAYRVGDI
jgi:hypothetical protein